jgi:hypothetical protein
MKPGVFRGSGKSNRRVVRAQGHEDRAFFFFEHAQPRWNRFGRSWVAELTKKGSDCMGVVDGCAADQHAPGKMAVMLLSFHKSSSPSGQF